MTKYLGKIVLAPKVYQTIRWFTLNWDKEIAAFGSGVVKNGEMFIEKLHFPNQRVGVATVDFNPADWGPMIKEMTIDEIKKICFYWHKHPNGSPHASGTDEEDSFDAIMDSDANKKYFGFAQSAKTTGDGIDWEARIELRKPLWGTLECEVTTQEDQEIEAECEKILDTRIKKPETTKYFTDKPAQFNKEIKQQKLDNLIDTSTIDLSNLNIPVSRTFYPIISNGAIHIFIGNLIEKSFLEELEKRGTWNKYVAEYHARVNAQYYKIYVLTPKKKCFSELKEVVSKFEEGYEIWVKKYLRNQILHLENDNKLNKTDTDLHLSAIEGMNIETFFSPSVKLQSSTNIKGVK